MSISNLLAHHQRTIVEKMGVSAMPVLPGLDLSLVTQPCKPWRNDVLLRMLESPLPPRARAPIALSPPAPPAARFPPSATRDAARHVFVDLATSQTPLSASRRPSGKRLPLRELALACLTLLIFALVLAIYRVNAPQIRA